MKKRMIISIIAVLTILATVLCACGGSSVANSPASNKSLEQHGMDVINLMDEMLRSDEYLAMMTSATEFQEIVEEMRNGDYTEPDTVYKISVPEDTFGTMMAALGEDAGVLKGMSDTLYDTLNKKVTAGMINQINAQSGVTYLALTSIFTAGKTFVSDEMKQDFMYLYTFEKGYPIFVIYTMGEGGAVTASGSFFMNKEMNFESVDDVESLLGQVGLMPEAVEAEAVTVEAE